VLCQTEATDLKDMVSKHPIIRLPVCTHSMAGHSMVLSLEQGVVASRGVEAVAEHSVAAEDSVVGGGNAWGSCDGKGSQSLPQVDSHPVSGV